MSEDKSGHGNEKSGEGKSKNIHSTPRIAVWRRLWFQVLIGTLVGLTVLTIVLPPLFGLLNLVSGVLIPLAIAFTLAYIVNPLVTILERRVKISRPISAVGLMSLVAISILALVVYVVPPLVSQSVKLINSAPAYYETVEKKINEISSNRSFDLREMILGYFDGADESEGDGGQAVITDGQSGTGQDELQGEQAAREGTASSAGDKGEKKGGGISSDLLSTITKSATKFLTTSFGAIASTLGFASYLALSLGIIAFAFFFFTWKFQAMLEWFEPFIPASYQAQTYEMLKKMDASIAAFIRGRLIQMSVITVVLAVGWSVSGVPFWLLLAIIGGVLNLIPYAPVLIWPAVISVTYITALSGDAPGLLTDAGTLNYVAVFVWPSVVYFVAQSLDGWVVEPLVQGKATNLDPLTVMIVVLLGAAILGILGMLIAIPVAACVKIVSSEILLPKLREIAKEN
ncbi:hypothetical protein KS4_11890 [Poriferisphaera corsica]|uniref:AI-2E family transporter n=1 Tax=Poriferisphaera corsica TaxID=2528020 RepID=A0A517YSE7_9BACT|nr:AI-2E family transporter [Poriferisphaera corsica]QDU33144.1 hypothetical protein KS4_11890 [Poriferisphaera corsica]